MVDYPSACFPNRVRIFGCLLEPLTLGHALVLQYLRSPFAPGVERTREPNRGDVLLGVWVCSRPWWVAARDAGTWRSAMWLRAMVCFLALFRVKLWYRDLLWVTYITEANAMPPVWRKKSVGTALGLPPLLNVKMSLMTFWNKSEAEAMATPLGQALLEHGAYLSTLGEMRFPSNDECELMEGECPT